MRQDLEPRAPIIAQLLGEEWSSVGQQMREQYDEGLSVWQITSVSGAHRRHAPAAEENGVVYRGRGGANRATPRRSAPSGRPAGNRQNADVQLSAPGRPCPDRDFDVLAEAADNAGRWGAEDALGALNLITAAVARQAGTEVRDGLTLSLAWPFEPARLTLSWPSADIAVDEALVAPHGETITHLDAPGHIYLQGRSYNNAAPDTDRDRLSHRGDITVGAAGVVTRGVLLDMELLLGARPPVGSYLHGTDLAQAAVAANIAVMPGDALVLHTGAPRGHAANQPSYGLCGCAAGWLHETGTAVYSGDCVERLPFPSPRYPLPFHQLAIARAGIALVDNPRLDALVAACRERGRRTFAYVLAPPPLLGATGAAVNPLAVL